MKNCEMILAGFGGALTVKVSLDKVLPKAEACYTTLLTM